MESRTSLETKVLFMTTGIFLMRLVNNPESFNKYTHIIMDEVHERDLDIDFSLVVLKHLLARMQTQSSLQGACDCGAWREEERRGPLMWRRR